MAGEHPGNRHDYKVCKPYPYTISNRKALSIVTNRWIGNQSAVQGCTILLTVSLSFA